MTKSSIFKKNKNTKLEFDDQPLQLVPLRVSLIIYACTIFLLGLLAWSIFGSIYTQVTGSGILLPGGSHLYPVVSRNGGIVKELMVKQGQMVKKGDIIAEMEMSALEHELKEQQEYVDFLKSENTKIHELSKSMKISRAAYEEILNRSYGEIINYATLYANYLSAIEAGLVNIEKEGYISGKNLEQYKKDLYSSKEDVETAKVDSADSMYTLRSASLSTFMTLSSVDESLLEEENSLKGLQREYNNSRYVRSHIDGVALQPLVTKGSFVSAGQDIINVAPKSDKSSVLVLIDPSMGKMVKDGMTAYVAPTYINKYQYGSIVGTVERITGYPADKQAILSVVQEPAWLSQLGFVGQSMLIAWVDLAQDKNSKSGFSWTSQGGAPNKISSGSFMNVTIQVRQQAPITLAIPLLRKWLGMGIWH